MNRIAVTTLLAAAVGLCLAGAARAQQPDLDELTARMERMYEFRRGQEPDGRFKGFYTPIITNDQLPREIRLQAARMLINCPGQWDRLEEIVATVREELPQYAPARRWIAEQWLRKWHQRDDAVKIHEMLHQLAQDFADDPEMVAWARVRRAYNHHRNRREAESVEYAEKALAADPNDPNVRSLAQYLRLRDARGDDARETKLDAGEKLMSVELWQAIDDNIRRATVDEYTRVLSQADQHDQAIRFARWALDQPWDRREWQQHAVIRLGDAYHEAGQYDQAVATYERVFVEFPGEVRGWEDTQSRLVRTVEQIDPNRALPHARVALDAAREWRDLRNEIRRIADIFRRIDTHVARANAFILYQKHGPAGADGKPGTDDDPANPLEEIPYPDYTEREKAFRAHHATLDDDAQASAYLARAMLFAGKPQEALRYYLDAYRRSDTRYLEEKARHLIFYGVRAATGSAAGLQRYYDYLNYGPAGPDEKPNTADDLDDPFAPLQAVKQAPRPGRGGVDPLAEADREAIARLEAYLLPFTKRPEQKLLRLDALRALNRIHQTLDNWGDEGQLAWYMDLLRGYDLDEPQRDQAVRDTLSAAKGRSLHLGDVRACLKQLEQIPPPTGPAIRPAVRNMRGWMTRTTRALDGFPAPDTEPIRFSATNLHLDQVKPLEEN